MIICNFCDKKFNYEFEKLTRLFLPFEKITVVNEPCFNERYAVCRSELIKEGERLSAELFMNGKRAERNDFMPAFCDDESKERERRLSVCLFRCLFELTGIKPAWGILTGVRPARLFSATVDKKSIEAAERYFEKELLVTKEKISLCEETYKREEGIISLSEKNDASLYISVPFCPSRCAYCSFVSHSVEGAAKLIPLYVEYLCRELLIIAETVKKAGLRLKTVYMGGGTPTTLSAEQLKTVFDTLKSHFDMSGVAEFTVEAGRPDTVTEQKLAEIKAAGATRISINPQSMNDEVLKRIGRRHTAKQMIDAFHLARDMGFDNINTDLIAGLSGDTFEGFCNTLYKIRELDPESVTVHSLSVKRASTLNKNGDLPDTEAETAAREVSFARKFLSDAGLNPYYMYRQSKTVGNLENVGYAKPGFEGLYNVYIMDETHTILAAGASAVTKLRLGNSIKRIFNYKYPYEYIDRFDIMNERKEEIVKFYADNT